MLPFDFQNNLGHWICMTAHQYKRAMNEELSHYGITFRQCQVLSWLAMEGDISQVELADRMQIEPPTLVRILDRMERDDLVRRIDCPNDRRRKLIQPRPKAKPVWKKIVTCAESVRQRAQTGLSSSQLGQLKLLLSTVQSNLDRVVRHP